MKFKEREKALELRIKHQLGFGTIARKLKVSKGTLSRWLRDYPLSKDRIYQLRKDNWGSSEAKRELFRQTMRKKRDEKRESDYAIIRKKIGRLSRQSLFVAGLMLYLAEGDKKNDYHIGLANTDPEIIRFFVWWLGEFFHIPKSRLRIILHLYSDMDLEKERKYWQSVVGVPREQFYKDQIRPIRPNSFSYSESFRHGTCKIYVHGVKDKTELTLSIRAFFDTYRGFVTE